MLDAMNEKEYKNYLQPQESLPVLPEEPLKDIIQNGLITSNNFSSNFRDFYEKNGNHSVLETLQIEIISDINRCYYLWNEFSPKKSLFDTWEFRYAFYQAYKYTPFFLLIKSRSENLALFPLEYDQDKKQYVWFGSSWQEENKFFTKDSVFIPLLLEISPKPLFINAIDSGNLIHAGEFISFLQDESKYILDLTKIKTVDDYLMILKKKRRQNLRRDRKAIEEQNPKIIFDEFSYFEDLVRLSKERFKQKGEEADWEDLRRVEAFRQMIKLAGRSYKIRMITVLIDNKVAGVDLIALFNGCYYTVKCGYDVQNFPGIGNFVNLFEIDDAIELGMKKIDFLQNSYEWKNRFFTSVPLFKYEKL